MRSSPSPTAVTRLGTDTELCVTGSWSYHSFCRKTDGSWVGFGYNAYPDIHNDGVPNADDAFPYDPNESKDTDGDGIGDNADPDLDGDGYANGDDAFPNDPSEHKDTDGDGIGDNSDPDLDGDGTPNDEDAFPTDGSESIDTDGDGIGNGADPDDDGDGTADANDCAPLDAAVHPFAEEVCNGIDDDCKDGVDTGTCSDDNPCTADLCDPTEGCSNPADDTGLCSDDDPCTGGDSCVGGQCVGTLITKESAVCNNVDDDCDGQTDEDCSYRIGGHVWGGGFVTGTDDSGRVNDGSTGTPRFIGASSNGAFTIRGGLPPRGDSEHEEEGQ